MHRLGTVRAVSPALPSNPDAFATMPVGRFGPAEPSDFIVALRAHAEQSAQALRLFGGEGI